MARATPKKKPAKKPGAKTKAAAKKKAPARRSAARKPAASLAKLHEEERAVAEVEAARDRLRDIARGAIGVTGAEDAPPLREGIKRSGAGWYTLIALGLLVIVDQFQGFGMFVLGPEIADGIGITRGTLAFAVAMKTLAVTVATLPFAALAQRKARRASIAIITAFAWSVITLGTGIVTSVAGLLIVLIADGATSGSVDAVHKPLLYDTYPTDIRVRVDSAYRIGVGVGNIAAPLLVGLLTAILGFTWRGVFLVMGLVSVAASFFALRLRDPGFGRWDTGQVRRAVRGELHEKADETIVEDEMSLGFFEIVRRLLLIKTVRRILVAEAVFGMFVIPLTTYLFFFLEEKWGMGPGARSLLFASFPLYAIPALLVVGRRGDEMFRRDPGELLRYSSVFLAASVLLIVGGVLSPVFALMCVLFGLAVASFGLLNPLLAVAMLSVVPPRMRPHASALIGIAVAAVGGIGGLILLGGVDNRFGLSWAICFLAVPGIVATLIMRTSAKMINGDLDHLIDGIVEEEKVAELTRAGQKLPMLACRNVDFSYGQLQVLFDVSFAVDDGEMVALLGTNGAGKSTLLRVISGLGLPSKGSVRFRGTDITYVDAERRLQLGITQVPGGRAIFRTLSVVENMKLFAYTHGRDKAAIDRGIDACFDAFPRLAERRNVPAGTLSGGEQQMLGIGKAFILRPRLLLIDELSLGLAPKIVTELLDMVRRINADGTAVVLVEQSVNVALSVVDHAYFMEKGEIRFDGKAKDLLKRTDLLRSVFLKGAAAGLAASKTGDGDAMTIAGFEFTGPVLLLGTITGITYGLLAVGLVLVFRSNRLINFAHGEIGALAAATLGIVVTKWHVPYWVALPGALVLAGAIGATAEVAVVRRLRNVPNLMSIVATLGVAQFLLVFSFVVNAQAGAARLFPQPSGFPEFDVGPLRVTRAYSAMLVLSPILVIALSIFLRRSRYGIAIRGAADNADAARMAGVSAGRMSTLSWAIAGAVSAFTAILIFPTRGFVTVESLGPSLLLRALVAAVIARMRSLPIALAAGIGVGILEQELLWNFSGGGVVEATLFVVILLALLIQPRHGSREEEKGSWASVQPWPPLPDALRQIWTIRNLGWIFGGIGLVIAIVIGFLATNAAAITLVVIGAFGMVGLSFGVVTGLGGQLTLGQFAVAAIGATVSSAVVANTGNFFLGFGVGGLAAAAVSALIGLPALRIRGLMLAVTTLSFALAAQAWLLSQNWMLGEGEDPGRPIFGSNALDTGREYYLFSLIFVVIAVWLARNVWRSGFGRRLRAIRDNEDNARAFTVRTTVVKLQGFAVAGFLAGLGGCVYGHALSRLSNTAFPVGSSIDVVAMGVLGGVGLMAGPIIGALYIIGFPEFVPLDSAGLAAQKLGWLLLILYVPGGIAALVRPIRDRIIAFLARGRAVEEETAEETADAKLGAASLVAEPAATRERSGTTILSVGELTKRYGGVTAVENVTFDVIEGQTLGIIGPNGAGKTTLFELIGGFTKPDTGHVTFAGRDVSSWGPERRGKLGLIRSFQDASLFPTMSVLESVKLALERKIPTRVSLSLVALDFSEKRRDERAREIVSLMGLDGYRHKPCGELSTGTRRITEIACMLALEPSLLLLDEPSSGVAQRETEALGELLERVKAYLGTTLIVIEHDMPLIMGLSDRIIAMESGRVIADDTPDAVRSDERVIESYLGGDSVAIERSGIATTAKKKAPARKRTGAKAKAAR